MAVPLNVNIPFVAEFPFFFVRVCVCVKMLSISYSPRENVLFAANCNRTVGNNTFFFMRGRAVYEL